MRVNQVLSGRYHVQEPLGSGGMAVVWRAHDEVLGRAVAIKVLDGAHADDPSARQRIRDEARHAATLSHQNIAQVYDFGESPDDHGVVTPYLVLELVSGQTLSQLMRAGPLPYRDVLRICAEVAAALAAAHADGLVHRDIKPANVMVTATGVKVVDFGIAAAIDAGGDPLPYGAELFGTAAYLAPERLTGTAVQAASDVYALGVLLYWLLAGRSPWTVETTTQLLSAHVYVEPDPLPPIPGLPESVVTLCNRAIDKNPTNRPTARDAAAVLTRAASAMSDGAVTDTTPVGGVASVGPPSARRRRLLIGAGVTAAVATAALVWIVAPLGGVDGDLAAGGVKPSATPAAIVPDTRLAPSASSGPVRTVSTVAPQSSALPNGRPGGVAPRAEPTGPVDGPKPGPKPTPKPTATTAPPGSNVQRTFASPGGSVTARCPQQNRVELVSWAAMHPYTVERLQPGPAETAVAVFVSDTYRVQMTVACADGMPASRTVVVDR